MVEFRDHFSAVAPGYARHRPGYPPELFSWLSTEAPGRALAWDAGTGSGQAAVELGQRFDRVVATDASAEQVARAQPHPRVEYRVAPAEHVPEGVTGADLVTVAQAVHWFDRPRFWAAARAVLAPEGLLAVWGYGHHRVDAAHDAVVDAFNRDRLAGLWPPERELVDGHYRALDFPFAEITAPGFVMVHAWTLAETLGYLRTWSALRALEARGRAEEAEAFFAALAEAWGDPEARKPVRWPLFVRAGRPT